MRKPTFLLPGAVIAGLLLSSLANSAEPAGQFTPFKGDGFYWYAKPPAEPVQPASSPIPPPPPSQEAPKKSEPLSMKWLSENWLTLMHRAADNPSKENVANYYYAQRILLDKSQNFSTASAEVIATDPFLDENNRVPISQFANAAFQRQNKKDQEALLKILAGKTGIWLFTDKAERCMACKDYEADVLVGRGGIDGLTKEFGFNYRSIDVSTAQGKKAAKRLKLRVTPTTVLVSPPDKFILLSQGLMSSEALRARIVVGARVAGLFTPEEAALSLPFNKGILKNEDIELDTDGKDPSDVMKTFRERIQTR